MSGGWTNEGITTLVIPTGATSGARVVIDGTTGEISVYNSSNILVGQWGGTNGCFFSFPINALSPWVEICNGIIQWGKANFATPNPPQITSPDLNVNGNQLEITSGFPDNSGVASSLTLLGGQTAAGAEIRASQRNIPGDVLQLDTTNNADQLVHVNHYSGSVVDAFGDIVIAHGAQFTPAFGLLMPWDINAVGQGWQLEWFQNPFTATNMSFFVRNQTGAIPGIGTTVGVHAVLFG